MTQEIPEVDRKLMLLRQCLESIAAGAIILRGIDWFAWATGGGSSCVLLTAETGIAEVVVTRDEAWILTNEIEAQRLRNDEVPDNFRIYTYPWALREKRHKFLRDISAGQQVLSDVPEAQELTLPDEVIRQKMILSNHEIERYRDVGRLAAEAMTDVLTNAHPSWTEYELAGAGAEALWSRGIHPALVLAAGERRLNSYRHPTATRDSLGSQAMLVFCARRYGLYANLTRFVNFTVPSDSVTKKHAQLREVEADVLDACRANQNLPALYQVLVNSYRQHAYADAIFEHHQGGITGYRARETLVTPSAKHSLATNMAIALNPSVKGAKIEDTFLLEGNNKLENLTYDSKWPHIEVRGRARPLILER